MTLKALKHIVPLALLIAMSIIVFKSRSGPQAPSKDPLGQADPIVFDPSRFLVRPFHAQGNQVALALDGGALPADNGKVPSVVVGKNILRMVHLAWVHDWTRPDCVASFNNLRLLYDSEEGASLPALRIYLNPVFSDEAGEAVHRAMLRIFFHSENRGCYLQVAHEIGAGLLAPDAEAIRSHIEIIDPPLIDDWENPFGWLEDDIKMTFSNARAQRDRNHAILNLENPSQLTSMLAVMPPLANHREIIAFVKEASAAQNAWLRTSPSP